MSKSTFLTTTITALFLVTLGVNSGIAAKDNGKSETAGTQTEQTETSSDGSGHHDNIDSGRDFGQHVKEHNDHFSGDHNPGKNHKGYSGIKDK
jgi:hypothetical protein